MKAPLDLLRDAAALLQQEMAAALDTAGLRPALAAWWRPRLARIADWVAEQERLRRLAGPKPVVRWEVSGEWTLPGVGRPFQLRGRADRIERNPDGTLSILDYKTGVVPNSAQVQDGLSPQLPLEAAMAAAGVFGADLQGDTAELTYWHLTGGPTPGNEAKLFSSRSVPVGEAIAEALIDAIARAHHLTPTAAGISAAVARLGTAATRWPRR